MTIKKLKERLKDIPDNYRVMVRASDAYTERCCQEGGADEVLVYKSEREVWLISNNN